MRMPAEWERVSGVLVSFPHGNSDWSPYLSEARAEFVEFIKNISNYATAIVIVDNIRECEAFFEKTADVKLIELPTNDTWIRDYGVISVEDGGEIKLLDFFFNGWGLKFASNLDNQINKKLAQIGLFDTVITQDLVLEGGSIESNGEGEMLTTSNCLLEPNRNPHLSLAEIEQKLKDKLGAKKIHILKHGHLIGDDTDAHIDTLARFASPRDIVYVKCYDRNDEHFEELSLMERELSELRDLNGEPFILHPLPLPKALYFEGERVPATYANFLIVNGAVIFPTYEQDSDKEAKKVLENAFKGYEIVPSPSSVIVRQHGSLHCSSMQLYGKIATLH